MTNTVVALPEAVRKKVLTINVVSGTALLVLSIMLLTRSSALMAGVFLLLALISALRMRGLLRNQHVAIIDGVLRSYEPHRGGVNRMLVTDIASIQFRAGSDRGLLKLPDRYLVRHKRFEREMEIYLLADTQRPKLDAFFQQHFPEQYQEPIAHLPGFPPTRE